jgi:hypothetical protein
MSIYNLLSEPNPDDPLVSTVCPFHLRSSHPLPSPILLTSALPSPFQIAEQYRTDRKKYDATAKDYVKKVGLPPAFLELAHADLGIVGLLSQYAS